MFLKNETRTIQLIIVLGAILLFVPFLGVVHLFDWDEINFAESAREMITSGDYLTVQINYLPFWEKPPLFIWLQVLSMKIFGINEFAARFPNAICGLITLLLIFNIGKRFFDKKFAIFWVLAYAGSILPHFYFKSGIIDPWFNLFIFLGIVYFIDYLHKDTYRKLYIVLSAVFIGLAVLTKGPVALLIFLLSGLVFIILRKFKLRITFIDILIYAVVFVFVGGFWFLLQILNGNSGLIMDFIIYQIRLLTTQDAGHGGFFLYHFVVLFFGVFPASVLAIKAFKRKYTEIDYNKTLIQWMLILFWVVLILFTIVKTKIVHYSSLCYFPLTFLAAYSVYKMVNNEMKWSKWITILLISLSSMIFFLIVLLQYIAMNAQKIIAMNVIHDKFAVGNLHAQVHWSGFEFMVGFILVAGIVGSILYFKNERLQYRIAGIFASSILFTNLTIIVLVPRIEQYSQHAAIEFYEKVKGEDCYVETLGFKSYAKYFYFEKNKPTQAKSYDEQWLAAGEIDKTVYFVIKVNDAEDYLKAYPSLKRLYEKNGFVFFARYPKK